MDDLDIYLKVESWDKGQLINNGVKGRNKYVWHHNRQVCIGYPQKYKNSLTFSEKAPDLKNDYYIFYMHLEDSE